MPLRYRAAKKPIFNCEPGSAGHAFRGLIPNQPIPSHASHVFPSVLPLRCFRSSVPPSQLPHFTGFCKSPPAGLEPTVLTICPRIKPRDVRPGMCLPCFVVVQIKKGQRAFARGPQRLRMFGHPRAVAIRRMPFVFRADCALALCLLASFAAAPRHDCSHVTADFFVQFVKLLNLPTM